MLKKIGHICYADDDPDDHFIFSTVMNEIFPLVKLTTFYRCNSLVEFLKDDFCLLPDLIFLDYNMPGNDGNECLRWIKSAARLLHIPTIIYSTSGSRDLIQSAYKNGAYKYVIKPSSIEHLADSLVRIVNDLETGKENIG